MSKNILVQISGKKIINEVTVRAYMPKTNKTINTSKENEEMGNVSDDDTQTIETMFSTISTFEIGLNNRQNQMSTLMEHIIRGRNEKNNIGTVGGQSSTIDIT